MWRFVGHHLNDPKTFTAEQLAEIRKAVATIVRDRDNPDLSGDGSPYYLLMERTVDWCLAHPEPIPVPESPVFKR